MTGFQQTVGVQPAPGVEGDFCDSNPRATVNAGPGGFVAGPLGLVAGRFAWASYDGIDPNNAPTILNNYGTGAPTGFIHREQQGLITEYLAEASMRQVEGTPATAFMEGGFWVKNNGATAATYGMKAFANYADGTVSFAAAGGAAPTAAFTGSIAAETLDVEGSISGNILTVTTVNSGVVAVGALLAGTGGGGVATGTRIVGQLSGDAGEAGTYALSIPNQTVTETNITGTYGTLTVTAVSSGELEVGATLAGTGGGGVAASTAITALGTGTGLTGTYIVNNTQTVTSTAIVATLGIETKWYARSAGLAGELVKMSSYPLG